VLAVAKSCVYNHCLDRSKGFLPGPLGPLFSIKMIYTLLPLLFTALGTEYNPPIGFTHGILMPKHGAEEGSSRSQFDLLLSCLLYWQYFISFMERKVV
jgi:hypothetical protein